MDNSNGKNGNGNIFDNNSNNTYYKGNNYAAQSRAVFNNTNVQELTKRGFHGKLNGITSFPTQNTGPIMNTDYGVKYVGKPYRSLFEKEYVVPYDVAGFNNWTKSQELFFNTNSRYKFMLLSYTHRGDRLANSYVRGFKQDFTSLFNEIIKNNESIPFSYQICDNYDYLMRNDFVLPAKDVIMFDDGSISIDSIKELFKNNVEKFKYKPHINRLLGEYSKELNEIIHKAPRLNQSILVYRGVTTELHIPPNAIEYTFNGFISTTIDPGATVPYLNRIKSTSVLCCMYEIEIPAGLPFVYLQSISKYTHELEILLPLNFRVNTMPRLYKKDIISKIYRDVDQVIVRKLVAINIDPSRNIKFAYPPEGRPVIGWHKKTYPVINNTHRRTVRNSVRKFSRKSSRMKSKVKHRTSKRRAPIYSKNNSNNRSNNSHSSNRSNHSNHSNNRSNSRSSNSRSNRSNRSNRSHSK
jgi:ADP-ribosyltransferase exoenzyme